VHYSLPVIYRAYCLTSSHLVLTLTLIPFLSPRINPHQIDQLVLVLPDSFFSHSVLPGEEEDEEVADSRLAPGSSSPSQGLRLRLRGRKQISWARKVVRRLWAK
jgi:hypothetical protein